MFWDPEVLRYVDGLMFGPRSADYVFKKLTIAHTVKRSSLIQFILPHLNCRYNQINYFICVYIRYT